LFRAGFSVRPLESSTSLSNAGPLASSGFSTSWFDILDFDCLRSITSHGLNTFEYTSHPGDSVDRHFISDVPFYDLDDDDPVIESSIDLIHAPLLSASSSMVDPSSRYLYALDIHLQDTHSDHTCFYQTTLLPPSSGAPLHAHMDAGSMASTTDCLAFLWDFQSLDGSATTLRVADATPHHPTGIGYLRVPILESPGFTSVRTFYTPSLPATILSPTSIASDLHFLGYSSFANLDGQHCCLRIHGSADAQLTFPLQLQHGLLFTQALHQPPPHLALVPSTLFHLLLLLLFFLFSRSLRLSFHICGISVLVT